MERQHAHDGRRAALIAAALGVLTLAGYVALLLGEGDSPFRARPLVFVVVIAVASAVAAGAGLAGRGGARTAALWLAAALFGVAGLLGIFSIGLPLLVAAVLSAVAASRAAQR